jgi:hypothetical protein
VPLALAYGGAPDGGGSAFGTEDVTSTPIASRSTSEEEFENPATTGSSVVAPTVTALEIQPGELTPVFEELFPEAITVAMPTESKLSIAGLRALVSQAELKVVSVPKLMFTAAI